MRCPYCNGDVPDFCPFSMCPCCGQPLEARQTGNGIPRPELRGGRF